MRSPSTSNNRSQRQEPEQGVDMLASDQTSPGILSLDRGGRPVWTGQPNGTSWVDELLARLRSHEK